jgi:hypothetical protein
MPNFRSALIKILYENDLKCITADLRHSYGRTFSLRLILNESIFKQQTSCRVPSFLWLKSLLFNANSQRQCGVQELAGRVGNMVYPLRRGQLYLVVACF